jgi:hypothetical protein
MQQHRLNLPEGYHADWRKNSLDFHFIQYSLFVLPADAAN